MKIHGGNLMKIFHVKALFIKAIFVWKSWNHVDKNISLN